VSVDDVPPEDLLLLDEVCKGELVIEVISGDFFSCCSDLFLSNFRFRFALALFFLRCFVMVLMWFSAMSFKTKEGFFFLGKQKRRTMRR